MIALVNRALAAILFFVVGLACATFAVANLAPATAETLAATLRYAPLAAMFADGIRVTGPSLASAAFFAVVAALAFVATFAELRPPARRVRVWHIASDGPGRTAIDLDTLDAAAERASLDVAGIERVRARVIPHDDAFDVRASALVDPSTRLAHAAPLVERAIAERLEALTGTRVRRVDLRAEFVNSSAAKRVR
jgi:hypothetical protein